MVPSKMVANSFSKDNIPELNVKKEFIERQLAIVSYAEEAERLSLCDILHDPLVVHSLEDYSEAYQEQERLRLIKSTMKSLKKIKRKNIDLTPFLDSLTAPKPDFSSHRRAHYIEASSFVKPERAIFNPLPYEEPVSYNKDIGVEDFKNHLRWIDSIPRFTIQQPTFTRNMPASSSHSQLLRKLEKQDTSPMLARPANEITTTTMFKNGVMHPAPSICQRGIIGIPRPSVAQKIKGSPSELGDSFNMLKRPQFSTINRNEDDEAIKRQKHNESKGTQSKSQFSNGGGSRNDGK
ncbi:hypothetical protein PAEPH01_0636 [Pancytospora epiphaga]|nr:hypothetical protein PAEPH01_0636 [Pancytospora epiphaga]